jgi:acyl carrier protein
LIESVLGLERGDLRATARLRDDFGVDFLDLLELALAMEAELEVRITNRDLEELTTVDDLIHLASRALARGSGALHPSQKAGLSRQKLRRVKRKQGRRLARPFGSLGVFSRPLPPAGTEGASTGS